MEKRILRQLPLCWQDIRANNLLLGVPCPWPRGRHAQDKMGHILCIAVDALGLRSSPPQWLAAALRRSVGFNERLS
jgi:hypothetical protein